MKVYHLPFVPFAIVRTRDLDAPQELMLDATVLMQAEILMVLRRIEKALAALGDA